MSLATLHLAGVWAVQEESGMALVFLLLSAPDSPLLSKPPPCLGTSDSLLTDVQGPVLSLSPAQVQISGLCLVTLPSRCPRPTSHFCIFFGPLSTPAALRRTFADWLGTIPRPVLGAAQHRHSMGLHHVARDTLVCHRFVVPEVTAQPEAIGRNPRVATLYD